MDIYYKDFGFYKIDIDYVKYLNTIDSQVYYDNSPSYKRKPYLGLILNICDYEYCIPLTSSKKRHINWNNVSEHNYLVYEHVIYDELHKDDIYKQIGDNKYKKILAVLEIRKMIPIQTGLYEYIDFSLEQDSSYKDLLEKEYSFLKERKDNILSKAIKLYNKQKETHKIGNCYCNFNLLEIATKEYNKQ